MRKLSYLFLALAAVTPFITVRWMRSARSAYEVTYGVPIDGMGLLGHLGFGVLVMFVLLVIAAVFAALAYQHAGRPRSAIRIIELGTFLLLPPALMAFTYFVMLGHGEPPTECRPLTNGFTECWVRRP